MITLTHLRSRCWRPAAVIAALCTLLAMLAASPAGAAQDGGRPAAVLTGTGTVTVGALSPASPARGPGVPVIPGCSPSLGRYNRTQVCWPDGFTITWFNQDGEEIGQTLFTLIEDLKLNPASRTFSEKVWVYFVESTGEAPATDMTFFSTCDSPCAAADDFPEGAPLAVGVAGVVSFHDGIGAGKVQSDRASEDVTITAAGFTPVSFFWSTPLPFRCDDDLSSQTVDTVAAAASALDPAGCVFPKSIPALTLPISRYGASAAMIRWAQQHLSGKWGLQSASKPLNRLGNQVTAAANRKKVCLTDWAKRTQVPQDSCDEYAFAGSKQSAGLIKGFTSGKACAQVTAVEKSGKWDEVEPLGKYAASDKCVRGHIPLSQNRAAGLAFAKLVNTARLLPGDPFWVAVTA